MAETLQRAARERGRWLAGLVERRAGNSPSPAALLAAARGVLDDEGYETRSDAAGLTLANCPFRALAAEHTALVCGMNLAIMEGLLDTAGPAPVRGRARPGRGTVLRPAGAGGPQLAGRARRRRTAGTSVTGG